MFGKKARKFGIKPKSNDKRHPTTWEHLRRVFFTGLIVIIPVFIALWAVSFIVRGTEFLFGGLVDGAFTLIDETWDRDDAAVTVVRYLISFVLALVVIFLIGWLSTFFAVKKIISLLEKLVSQVPIVKFFYNTPKEVLQTFTMSRKDSFKRVVLFEYPRRGVWVIGFATSEVAKKPDGTVLVTIFLPTTPNPTSGFLLFVPSEDVYDTNIPVEQGARIIISGGILSPEEFHAQRFSGLGSEPDMPKLGPLTIEDREVEDIPPSGFLR